MKKVLLFIALLFVPFMVRAADLEIKELEYVDKSDLAEEVTKATFEDLSINISVRFHNLNDFIKYKITIKNNSNKDYDLSSEEKLTEYVNMKFEGIDGDKEKILKAKKTKTFYLVIYYAKEVPTSEFKDGSTFIEQEIKTIDFSPKETNPNTNTGIIIISILIVSGLFLTFLISKKNSVKVTMIVLIIMTMFLPLVRPTALEKIHLDVNSKVEIKHPSFFLHNILGPENKTVEILFDDGMTWEEFLESDYNTEGWTTTRYARIGHTTPQDTEIITYKEIPDGKLGILVGRNDWACGDIHSTWFENYVVITSGYEDYETTDKTIINGKQYELDTGTIC